MELDDMPELEDLSEELTKIRKNNVSVNEKPNSIKVNVIDKKQTDIKADKNESRDDFGGLFKKGFLKKSNQSKKSENEVIDLTNIKSDTKPKEQFMSEFKQELNKISNEDKNNLLSDVVNKKEEWLNQDLLSKIAQKPNLLKYFMDPRFNDVIALMQKDPEKAITQYGNIPEFKEFIKEFSQIMGDHFNKIAKEKEKKSNPYSNFDIETQEILNDPKITPIIQTLQREGKLDIELVQSDLYISQRIKTLIDKGVFRVQRESELNK
jgi:hypothetical protein